MAPVLPTLSCLLLHAATLSTSSVPATGNQEVLLTLDAPGAIHLSARSASGTSCVVLDRARGPFAESGAVGHRNCELDLLLDAGEYKVRLASPDRSKGQVTITANPFVEQNPSPIRLVPGVSVTTSLKPGQQATYWISMQSRGVPMARVSGRHAGDVRLWRNGEWLEPANLTHQLFSPIPGQPRHEWWLTDTLERGDYQLVVYGRDSTTVVGESVDTSLVVELGFRRAPPERSLAFTVPASGAFFASIADLRTTGLVTLDATPSEQVELHLISAVNTTVEKCRIEKAALAPECLVSGSDTRGLVFAVRGPPGTRGTLEWSDADASRTTVGTYGPPALNLGVMGGGRKLIGAHDLPMALDGPPLGCRLEELSADGTPTRVVASQSLVIRDGQKLERQFNYDGSNASVWFEIGSGGNLLQRAGVTTRNWKIFTTGELKSTCELYSVSGSGGLQRLTQSKPTPCNEKLQLPPGFYQLELSAGLSGVEKLTIAPEGDSSAKATAARGGCMLGAVDLRNANHRLILSSAGAVHARGAVAIPMPLEYGPAHLQLDVEQTLSVPLKLVVESKVRSAGGAPFTCVVDGTTTTGPECTLPVTARELKLVNSGPAAVSLTLSNRRGWDSSISPESYKPVAAVLPRISPETPLWFDFEQGQTQTAAFDVTTPGLYEVTTQGLLATSCRLRTPVNPDVASDTRGGRGRNCLIQTGLQKGRYLFTATTQGASKGRGALILTKRPSKDEAGLVGDGDQFFRAGAGDLIRQRLTVKTAGTYGISTTTQSASLTCRIDDADGWPLVVVPSLCSTQLALRSGTYLWTQFPSTVESMRHTSLHLSTTTPTLTGNKPHRIEAFTWYDAELGADGKDEFLFSLEGTTTLEWVLSNAMQGRIFALEKDKAPRAVEILPPQSSQATSESDSEGERSYGEYDEGSGEDGPPPEPQMAAPTIPTGTQISLPAGDYKLVTEHSRGDVDVSYQLHFGSSTLLPGMHRQLPVPSTIPVFIPRDGTLRLRTEGDADVRCRLFDAQRRLVLEGRDNGPDWNCALADPVKQGSYTLVLESETQQSGNTLLSLSLPPVDEGGELRDGQKLALAASVQRLALPATSSDVIQEVTVQAKSPVSCAVELEGSVVDRSLRTASCQFLVHPRGKRFHLRVWTTDGSAAVVVGLRTRSVTPGSPRTLTGDSALETTVNRPGRYRTGKGVFCAPSSEAGVLRSCGPEVSLDAGPMVFSSLGSSSTSLELSEQFAKATGAAQSLALTRRPWLQGYTTPEHSLFMLSATVQHGERSVPSCAFEGAGTVRERRDEACFAVNSGTAGATVRLWSPSDDPIDAQLSVRALPLPTKIEALTLGRRTLELPGIGRYSLPAGRTRVDLILPPQGWGVLLDAAGMARDLCAPESVLRRCVLTAEGGTVVVIAPQNRAELTVVALEGAPVNASFTGLYEDTPQVPGTVKLSVAGAPEVRVATIEGASRCTVVLADGTRIGSCSASIPAGTNAELLIEHDVEPVRAMVHAEKRDRAARMGMEVPIIPGGVLPASTAVPLLNGRLDRTLVLAQEAVVRVHADFGVCGLLRGNELLEVKGMDGACDLVRVVPAGSYRVLVRPFAGHVRAGTLSWSAESVSLLTEGVGTETWIGAGEARLFRFELGNAGLMGLGIQATSELLECTLLDDTAKPLGQGCHQFISLPKGRFLLTVRNPSVAQAKPLSFKPVVLGLAGDRQEIPDTYLQELFRRAGVTP